MRVASAWLPNAGRGERRVVRLVGDDEACVLDRDLLRERLPLRSFARESADLLTDGAGREVDEEARPRTRSSGAVNRSYAVSMMIDS